MDRRTETPLRWLRCVLRRASWLISAITSFMKGGTDTGTPAVGRSASPSMIRTSVMVSKG